MRKMLKLIGSNEVKDLTSRFEKRGGDVYVASSDLLVSELFSRVSEGETITEIAEDRGLSVDTLSGIFTSASAVLTLI